MAVSFSGCGSGQNFGFTYHELGEKLQAQFLADQSKLSVGEWERSNYTKENCYLYFNDDLYVSVTCTNKWSESFIDLIVTWEFKEEIGKMPKATDDYIYLVRTIYKVLEPDRTAEQEEEFERILINAINYPVKDRFTRLTQNGREYAFNLTSETKSFDLFVSLAE